MEDRTELDVGLLLADLVTVLVGEEHVGRQAALGRAGIFDSSQQQSRGGQGEGEGDGDLPFFFLPEASLAALVFRVVFASFGMSVEWQFRWRAERRLPVEGVGLDGKERGRGVIAGSSVVIGKGKRVGNADGLAER